MSQDYDPVPCMFSLWMNLLSSLGAYMRLAMFGMVCTPRALAKFKTFDTTYVRTTACWFFRDVHLPLLLPVLSIDIWLPIIIEGTVSLFKVGVLNFCALKNSGVVDLYLPSWFVIDGRSLKWLMLNLLHVWSTLWALHLIVDYTWQDNPLIKSVKFDTNDMCAYQESATKCCAVPRDLPSYSIFFTFIPFKFHQKRPSHWGALQKAIDSFRQELANQTTIGNLVYSVLQKLFQCFSLFVSWAHSTMETWPEISKKIEKMCSYLIHMSTNM